MSEGAHKGPEASQSSNNLSTVQGMSYLRSLCVCLSRAALRASYSSDTSSTLCFQISRLLLLSRRDCMRHMLSICRASPCSSPSLLCSWLERPADCPWICPCA